MATTPWRCSGTGGTTCHCFDHLVIRIFMSYVLWCRGLQCSSDVRCDYCRSWSSEEWARLQAYDKINLLYIVNIKQQEYACDCKIFIPKLATLIP